MLARQKAEAAEGRYSALAKKPSPLFENMAAEYPAVLPPTETGIAQKSVRYGHHMGKASENPARQVRFF